MRYHNRTMNRRIRHNSQGVALVTAMLIVALATIAAVAVTSRQQFDIRRSANLLNGEQSYQFALGVESWAVQVLTRDGQQNQIDTLNEDWAQQLPPQIVSGGQVTGHIEDLQGRFNLNDLVDAGGQPVANAVDILQRLLTLLNIDNQTLPYAVVDWIDPDQNVNINGGAEDGEYLSKQPPYRTANNPMVSASELLLINGLQPADYLKLAPYVCALPTTTAINVNTASAQVLAAVSNIPLSGAQQMVADRTQNPYNSITDYTNALQKVGGPATPPANAGSPANVSVSSDYFLVAADAQFGNGRSRLFSELHRTATQTSVILRAQGVL